MSTLGDQIRDLVSQEPTFLDVDALAEKVEEMQVNQYRLAAALNIVLFDAHIIYGSTATWHGGMGGAAMTMGCAFVDPSPKQQWMELAAFSQPLRELLEQDKEIDLKAESDKMKQEYGG